MNKIYKLIWSKTKNCYVVASELAKRHTKSPISTSFGKTLLAGVLACLLNFSLYMSAYAGVGSSSHISATEFNNNYTYYTVYSPGIDSDYNTYYNSGIAINNNTGNIYVASWTSNLSGGGNGITAIHDYNYGTPESYDVSLINLGSSGGTGSGSITSMTYGQFTSTHSNIDTLGTTGTSNSAGTTYDGSFIGKNTSTGAIEIFTTSFNGMINNMNDMPGYSYSVGGSGGTGSGSGGVTYTAGNGVTITNNSIAAKAGTGITIDSNGISITQGSVASGNTNAVTGGTAYSELRPSSNGNYVKTANTTATNLTALDTQVKANATAISNEVTNRTTAVSNEATARSNADTALSNRIGTQSADGNYIKKSATNSVVANIAVLDTQLKTTNTNLSTETTNRTNADTALSNRIGTIDADKNYIKKSATNNVSVNLTVLDTQLKTTNDNLATEISDRITAVANEATARENADIALSRRIGSNDNDGHYVKKSSTNNLTMNVHVLDNVLYNTNEVLSSEIQNRRDADVLLSNRIGVLGSDGNYIQQSNDLSTNVQTLDAQIYSVTTDLANEEEARVRDVNSINSRIGNLTDNGEYVDTNDTIFENLMHLEDAIKGNRDNFNNVVSYDDETFATATLKGAEGTKLSNLKPAVLMANSTDAVIGSQLYSTNETLANEIVTRTEEVNSINTRIGSINSNGNFVNKDSSIFTNLMNLETAIKGNTQAFDNVVAYDNATYGDVTLKGNGGTKITNLKPATLSATSTDAVIGGQLFATNKNIEGMTADINRNKESIRALNISVTAALSSVGSTSSLVDVLDGTKADASLNNLTATGRQVIASAAANAVQEYIALQGSLGLATPSAPMMYSNSNPNTLSVTNAGNGSLFVGEGSNVNGNQSIAIGVGNQVNANNSGAFGDPSVIDADESYVLGNDDTINTGATGSFIVGNDSISNAKGGLLFGSNSTNESSAENSVGLGNHTKLTGSNSVALGSFSVAKDNDVISVGNNNLKRRIVNVADGMLSEDSNDVVTGSQLYSTNQRVQENANAISNKAEVNASNINTTAWSDKLGVGLVEANNTGLVNGGTVFNAINEAQRNSVVQMDNDTITVGANRGGRAVSVANNAGETRVITGVATDPTDASSVANVGFVQNVSQNIINAVNDGFTQVEHSFQQTNIRMNKVGANAAAMASLTPASFEGDEKWSLAASVGRFHGETAGAVGAFYKPTENVMMNVRGTVGSSENMLGAGVSVSLSKGDIPGVTKRQLATAVNNQAGMIQSQAQRIENQDNVIKALQEERENDRNRMEQQDKKIAELEAMVAKLAKKVG